MKQLLYFLAFLFTISSCSDSQFQQIEDETVQDAPASTGTPQDEIIRIVTNSQPDLEAKIGGKKRQNINVVATAGEKHLLQQRLRQGYRVDIHQEQRVTITKDGEKISQVTSEAGEADQTAAATAEAAEEAAATDEAEATAEAIATAEASATAIASIKDTDEAADQATAEARARAEATATATATAGATSSVKLDATDEGFEEQDLASQKKFDLVFYMQERNLSCIGHIQALAKTGFLNHFYNYNWQVSFASFTEEADLLPLQLYGRPYKSRSSAKQPDYVLSKVKQIDGVYPSIRVRNELLTYTLQPPAFETIGVRGGVSPSPDFSKKVENPLKGLDQILTQQVHGSIRDNSHVVVLLFGYKFPHYESESWDYFFNEHPNVSLIVLAPRRANVGNLFNVLENEKYDADFLACDSLQSLKEGDLINTIKGKVL